MSITTTMHDSAQALYGAIGNDPAWQEAGDFYGRHPRWWHRVVSSVLLLTGDEEIRYVTLTGNKVEDASNLEGLVFTDRLLVDIKVTAAGESDDADICVRGVGLGELRALRVEASAGTDEPWWPGQVVAELTFSGSDTFTIPLQGHRRWENTGQLHTLVRRLPRFL